MVAYITINGVRALVLFDTGSTLDCVSPEFARVANLTCYELGNPTVLQLGTVGSRSKINYGTDLTFTIQGRTITHYFDAANIDRYQAVVGVPFLRASKAVLDFGENRLSLFG
ncbi:hypothetical protein OE88DRAFT_1608220, partial [Heliocybe sulcata]